MTSSGGKIMWSVCKRHVWMWNRCLWIQSWPSVWFSRSGCDEDEEIFPPRSAAGFYVKQKLYKLNWSRLWPLLHEVVAQDTHHLCCIIAMILHVILTIWGGVWSPTLVILRSFFLVASLLISFSSTTTGHTAFCDTYTFDCSLLSFYLPSNDQK